jgi:hypothetical protein
VSRKLFRRGAVLLMLSSLLGGVPALSADAQPHQIPAGGSTTPAPPTQGAPGALAPPVAPGSPVTPDAACILTGFVFFQFYTSQVNPNSASPSPNLCWNWDSPVIQTDTFQTCSVNPYPQGEHYYPSSGGGTYKLYDDTNSAHTNPTDSSAIGTCLSHSPAVNNLYLEFLAGGPSWLRVSPPNGGAVTYYAAEDYTCDGCRDSLNAPSNDVPVVNVNPDVNNQSALTADIQNQCYSYTSYPTLVLYADVPVNSTVQGWINNALNGCFG